MTRSKSSRSRWPGAAAALFCLVLLSAPGVAPAGAAEDPFAPWRELSLGDAGASAAGRRIEIGHLAVDFADGAIWPVRAGNGELAGLFFSGSGKFVYRSDDPQDLASLQQNLKQANSRLDLRHNTLTDGVRTLLVLFARPAFEEITGSLADPASSAGQPPRAEFKDYFDLLALSDIPYDHRAVTARANGDPYQYVYVEIDGERQRTGYVFDQMGAFRESLFGFRKFAGQDYRFRQAYSRQIISGFESGGPAVSVLENGDFDITSDDNRSVRVVADLTFRIAKPHVRALSLALLNNRDPKSDRWESTRRALHVRKLETASGKALPFSHRYGELVVLLDREYAPRDEIELHFEYDGDFFTDPSGEWNATYRELAFVSWYPAPSGASLTDMAFSAVVRTKAPFMPVVTGDTILRKKQGEYWVVQAATDGPIDMPVVMAGRYKTHEVKEGDRTVRSYGGSTVREQDLKAMAGFTMMMWNAYQAMLGPLPWKEIEVVEIPSLLEFGISPPGILFLSSTTARAGDPVAREFQEAGANHLIAHELAHQWFGNVASPWDALRDAWLSESQAEYLAGLGLGIAAKHLKKSDRKVKKSFHDFGTIKRGWYSDALSSNGVTTVFDANGLRGDVSARVYRYQILYGRGPAILHMFRSLVGEERFLAIWKRYLDMKHPGARSTQDFIDACNEVMKSDWSWFWNQWLGKPWIPEIRISESVSGNRLHLVADQDPAKFMKIHLPVVLTYSGGRRGVKLLFQQQPHQEFDVMLPAAPQKVDVDPARNNLAIYK